MLCLLGRAVWRLFRFKKFAPVEFDRLFNFPDDVGLDTSISGAVWDWRFANARCLDPFVVTKFGWRPSSSGKTSFSAVAAVGELCFDEIGEQMAFEFNAEAESS